MSAAPTSLRVTERTRNARLIREALSLMQSKWSVDVLLALGDGSRRYHELLGDLEPISEKVLTQTLRAMERDGLIRRRVHAEVPPRVDYALTPLGRDARRRRCARSGAGRWRTARTSRPRASGSTCAARSSSSRRSGTWPRSQPNRSCSRRTEQGAAAPGPSSGSTCRSRPRSRTAGSPRVLAADEVGGRRGLVGDRDHGRVQLAAGGVGAPAPVVERREAGAADRDLAPGRCRQARPNESVITTAAQPSAGRAARGPRRRGRRGSSTSVLLAARVGLRRRRRSRTRSRGACGRSAGRASARTSSARLVEDRARRAAGPCRARRRAARARAPGSDVGERRRRGPRPSRRPCARRRARRRAQAGSEPRGGVAQQRAEVVARAGSRAGPGSASARERHAGGRASRVEQARACAARASRQARRARRAAPRGRPACRRRARATAARRPRTRRRRLAARARVARERARARTRARSTSGGVSSSAFVPVPWRSGTITTPAPRRAAPAARRPRPGRAPGSRRGRAARARRRARARAAMPSAAAADWPASAGSWTTSAPAAARRPRRAARR